MNDDLISRQAAIDALNKKRIETMGKGKDANLIWECLDAVAQVPSAQQWIPVTERLPEFGRYAIVTTSWAFVTKAMHCGDHWEIAGIDYKKSAVIAWMPLPEPYKGEQHG